MSGDEDEEEEFFFKQTSMQEWSVSIHLQEIESRSGSVVGLSGLFKGFKQPFVNIVESAIGEQSNDVTGLGNAGDMGDYLIGISKSPSAETSFSQIFGQPD